MIDGRRRVPPIRWALVGGGAGSAIGYIHRCAATRDRCFQLVAGAFDILPERGKQFGRELGLDSKRCYGTYKEMFEKESHRSDGIEAVTIATPNSSHFEICKAALESNLHVICEKPLCLSIEEAQYLQDLARERGRIVGVMFGYAGHQMIEQARQMVLNGEIGDIRIIKAEFAHGGCAKPSPEEPLQWRFNPEVAGPSFVLADLGVHPLYLIRAIVPTLKISRVSCVRQSVVRSRAPLEDNAFVTMEFDSGAVAFMWVSAVNTGSQHGLRIRIVGSEASIEWCAEDPNNLRYEPVGGPPVTLRRGFHGLYTSARAEDRISEGHSEGLFEAWANLYRRFANAIVGGDEGKMNEPSWYPDANDGAEAVRWVERCIESSEHNGAWVEMS
ncbi:Gfo/Idh/MocA family protein [Alicyclobacillus sendaiensis]|uniref:Gfo/Idh/MocA family oxidoreductase n=1 Tax=Alicyclobacillus sendaiensis PA2 TaxID=3029425 RepID=A0ABT6Y071_ALISE|nr:Gfo/Idh/MocA family oxidoreductase [Alicyclobacillus sendaiensis]MDI9260738.1 Gfo/Idh/MocA family oxidoreductase [Alicyclobacillus sendaiensis PA2]